RARVRAVASSSDNRAGEPWRISTMIVSTTSATPTITTITSPISTSWLPRTLTKRSDARALCVRASAVDGGGAPVICLRWLGPRGEGGIAAMSSVSRLGRRKGGSVPVRLSWGRDAALGVGVPVVAALVIGALNVHHLVVQPGTLLLAVVVVLGTVVGPRCAT